MKTLRRLACRRSRSSTGEGDDDPEKRRPRKQYQPSDKPGWLVVAERKAEERRREEQAKVEEEQRRQSLPDAITSNTWNGSYIPRHRAINPQSTSGILKRSNVAASRSSSQPHLAIAEPPQSSFLEAARRGSIGSAPSIDSVISERNDTVTTGRRVSFSEPLEIEKKKEKPPGPTVISADLAPIEVLRGEPTLPYRRNSLPTVIEIEIDSEESDGEPKHVLAEPAISAAERDTEDSNSRCSSSESDAISDTNKPLGRVGGETAALPSKTARFPGKYAAEALQSVEELPRTPLEHSVPPTNSYHPDQYQFVDDKPSIPEAEFGTAGIARLEFESRQLHNRRATDHGDRNNGRVFCSNCSHSAWIMNPRLREMNDAGLNIQDFHRISRQLERNDFGRASTTSSIGPNLGKAVDLYGASPPGSPRDKSRPYVNEDPENCRNCVIHCDDSSPPPSFGAAGEVGEWLRKLYQRRGDPLIPPDPEFFGVFRHFNSSADFLRDSFAKLQAVALKNKEEPWRIIAKAAMDGPEDYGEIFNSWRAATMFLYVTNNDRMRNHLDTMKRFLEDLEIEEPPPTYSDYHATDNNLVHGVQDGNAPFELPAAAIAEEVRPEVQHNPSVDTVVTQASSDIANDSDETDASSLETAIPTSRATDKIEGGKEAEIHEPEKSLEKV